MRLRKPLLFTAVFGVGLTTIWFIGERPRELNTRSTPRVARTPEVHRGGQEPEPIQFTGRLEYTQFSAEEREGRRPKLFKFSAAHVEPLGGEEYNVENLFVQLFEPESQAVRATLRSPKAQMPIRFRAGRREFGVEDTITLTAVDSEVFDGLPLVPARIVANDLTVALAEAVYSTPGAVVVNGQGARATGSEFTLDQRAGSLRFGRDGAITFSSGDLPETILAATGEGVLSVEGASGDDGEKIRVLVEGGALLETSAETNITATASRIEFGGVPTGEGTFAPASAIASGGVVIDGWGGRFAGERARFMFDGEGRLKETLLQGEPTARVPIAVEGGEVVQVELEATESVRLITDAGFSVKGPCLVRVPDRGLTLECNGQLFGAGGQQAGFGWLSASGGVRADLGAHQFEGEDLELRSFVGPSGDVEWGAHTQASATLRGDLARGNGAPYEATVGSDLELATAGEGLLITRATDVDLSVKGAEWFNLKAGELQDASLAERVFRASGGVHFSDRQLKAEAREVSAEPDGTLTLTGSGQEPAKLELTEAGLLPGGQLLAHKMRTAPGELSASGEVRAEFKNGEDDLDLEVAVLDATFSVDETGAPIPGPALLSLREVERCRLVTPEESISWSADSTNLSLFAHAQKEDEGDGDDKGDEAGMTLELRAAAASGGVLLERHLDGGSFAASGENLEFVAGGKVRLVGTEGSFVRLSGVFLEGDRFGRVIAREIHFVDQHMIARSATIVYEGGAQGPVAVRQVSADWIDASLGRVELTGGVHIVGESDQTGGWTLRSARARLESDGEIAAWDGFEWTGEDDISATGTILHATPEGIELEGEPAKLQLAGLEWEARGITLDRKRKMIEAGKGRVRSLEDDSLELTYDEIQPIEGQDATILGLRRPRFVRGETEARAEWALLWVDQNQGGAETAPRGEAPNLFGRVSTQGFSSALDEIYIEGHVEVLEAGVRRAEIEALYLDLVDGRGWLKGTRLTVPAEVGGEETELIVDAEWLRHSTDGSLTAKSARITTCDHIDPHYFIRTKNLRLSPSEEEGVRWDIAIRSNSLVFVGGPTIPLPALEYEADKAGTPLIDRLVLGDTARFGTVIQTGVDGELGFLKQTAAAITGADPEDIFGGVKYRASWLGKRGLMLGAGAELEAKDEFWFRLYADGLVDSSTDRGVLRVDSDERGDFRGWTRARGRATINEREWIDFAFSEQSDAGVQAEFFERDFLRYEERENYLHWRQADGVDFTAARVQLRAGAFRNEVEELPSLAYSHGRAPLFQLDGRSVLYQASADIGRYIRREANGGTVSPFDPFFKTELGTRRILRFDTRHRLELPTRFAGGGVTATPFLQLAGTSWSEGEGPNDSPDRAALSAGAELSTTLWRRSEGGTIHTIAPFIAVSGDLWSDLGEGSPVPLDSIDDPLPGDHADLGVHSRWRDQGTGEVIDLSLFSRYTRDTDTVQPLEVLAEYLSEVNGVPVALQHDGRYDLEAGETLYSRSAMGFAPLDDLTWELGFHRGKDADAVELFEAASVAARWRISPKWELGARQTISLLDSDELANRMSLRRYGHDLILDIEISERSGEGGTSVSFSLSPMVGWTRERLGLLDHWLARRR